MVRSLGTKWAWYYGAVREVEGFADGTLSCHKLGMGTCSILSPSTELPEEELAKIFFDTKEACVKHWIAYHHARVTELGAVARWLRLKLEETDMLSAQQHNAVRELEKELS